MTRRAVNVVLSLVAVGIVAWGVSWMLERLLEVPHPAEAAEVPQPAAATAHITATLFYVSPDGASLVPARQEVPLAQTVAEQGRLILVAQLQNAPPPALASAVPAGTELRAFYVSDRGDAFVDLSPEVTTAHPGGSQAELLTVYTLVDAVTANLPAVRRVQILVNGRDVDTLAGHVDLRRPLTYDVSMAADSEGPAPIEQR
jgi:spore germination protein GerM